MEFATSANGTSKGWLAITLLFLGNKVYKINNNQKKKQ